MVHDYPRYCVTSTLKQKYINCNKRRFRRLDVSQYPETKFLRIDIGDTNNSHSRALEYKLVTGFIFIGRMPVE